MYGAIEAINSVSTTWSAILTLLSSYLYVKVRMVGDMSHWGPLYLFFFCAATSLLGPVYTKRAATTL